MKDLSNEILLSKTKRLAQEERRIGLQVIHHLREIEDRRLYNEIGYSSLFECVTQELGYSEGSAHRRISAMRLLRELPEYEAKLEAGVLNVTNLSLVHTSLKGRSQEEKREIVSKLEGQSTAHTQRLIAQVNPRARR